jgi:hypothetical protein
VLSSVTPAGPLTKAAKLQKIGGELVLGVAGAAPAGSDLPAGAEAELWVAATGKPLPVGALEVSGSSRLEVFFIRAGWGKSVTGVAAPGGSGGLPGWIVASGVVRRAMARDVRESGSKCCCREVQRPEGANG